MIKINKKIGLEFLGEEYKDSYLVFQAITMNEIEEIQEKALVAQERQDPKENLNFFKSVVAPRFVEGKIAQDGKLVEVTKDDLPNLPLEVFIDIAQELMGRVPKAD